MDSKIPSDLRQTVIRQANVVSRGQLLGAGVPRTTIFSRLKRGDWQQVHPGVYRTIDGRLTWEARLWAASLYVGPGAKLSHETAAAILGLSDDKSGLIQLTIPARRKVQPQAGLKIHRSRVTYQPWPALQGFPPHTFYADTIIDLVAASDNLDDVVTWVSKGMVSRKVNRLQLELTAKERQRFRWGQEFKSICGIVENGSHFPLEFRYERDVERAHGLPAAVKQGKFQKPDGSWGYRDRRYDEYGLIVELDGKKFHDDEQRDRDRARDNEAVATADATLRYGWSDVSRTPCDTAAQVYRALRNRGYRGTLTPCSATCRAFLAAA